MTLLYSSNAWLKTWLNRQNLLRGSKLGEKKSIVSLFLTAFPGTFQIYFPLPIYIITQTLKDVLIDWSICSLAS